MIRKILAITGGGVKDVAFLTYMLRISKYYDNKGIDVLTLFDTFSGVSSGSIIASTFVLREKFLITQIRKLCLWEQILVWGILYQMKYLLVI